MSKFKILPEDKDFALMKGESEPKSNKCAFDNVNVLKSSNEQTGTYEIDHSIRVAVKYIPYSQKSAQAQGYKKDIEVSSILCKEPSAHTINIYKVQEIKKGSEPQKAFIVMEKGKYSLETLSNVDIDTKLKYVGDIAKGLQHLHKCGIVHRDLKAQNVLITWGNIAKVFDFGASKFYGYLEQNQTLNYFMNQEEVSKKVMLNTVDSIGTQIFNPPEILLNKLQTKVLGSCDMWQFGLLIATFVWDLQQANSHHYREDCQKTFETWKLNPNSNEQFKFPKFNRLNFVNEQVLIDLVKRCLYYHPDKRITSSDFVKQFFSTFNEQNSLIDRQSLDSVQKYKPFKPYVSPKNFSQTTMKKQVLKNFISKCNKQLTSSSVQKLPQVLAKLVEEAKEELKYGQAGEKLVRKLVQVLQLGKFLS